VPAAVAGIPERAHGPGIAVIAYDIGDIGISINQQNTFLAL